MPALTVPDPRFLQAALGPAQNHTTADELLAAAEHLMVLSFGMFFHAL